MKIFNELKSFIENPDSFVKKQPKNVILYSTILKIGSFTLILFRNVLPTSFVIASLFFLTASFYCDYKMIKNIDDLALDSIKNQLEKSPYNTGYYIGKIIAILIKLNLFQKIGGFFAGIKDELFV